MTSAIISRLGRAKLWIEQLDRVMHERPEDVLAANIVRQQAEIEALGDRICQLETHLKSREG